MVATLYFYAKVAEHGVLPLEHVGFRRSWPLVTTLPLGPKQPAASKLQRSSIKQVPGRMKLSLIKSPWLCCSQTISQNAYYLRTTHWSPVCAWTVHSSLVSQWARVVHGSSSGYDPCPGCAEQKCLQGFPSVSSKTITHSWGPQA